MHKVQRVRMDNGGDFCDAVIACYLCQRGIVHEKITAFMVCLPRAKRIMCSVMTTVRFLLSDFCLSARFWPYAAMRAVDMHN